MRQQQVDLKLISGDARETVTAVARSVGIPADAGVVEGPDLPDDKAALGRAAEENTVFCRITPEQKQALVGALADRGRFTAMIGDGVNDVPALKRARLAVAMGSGSQVTKGVADIVLLSDQFAMLPRAVAEGRRIARNIHRLGRLFLTKSVYAGVLILFAAITGFAFPFLPRHLTIAATLTIGIPSFVLALAPSEGPLYRGHLLRSLAAFAVPAGVGIGVASLLSFFFVDTAFGGTVADGRTAATTTLIVLGLCFILLLERGPGREHITIQSYMLALVAGLGALYALALAAPPVRRRRDGSHHRDIRGKTPAASTLVTRKGLVGEPDERELFALAQPWNKSSRYARPMSSMLTPNVAAGSWNLFMGVSGDVAACQSGDAGTPRQPQRGRARR